MEHMTIPLKTEEQIKSLCTGWITTIKECPELFCDGIDLELINAFKKIRRLLDFYNNTDDNQKD